MERHSADPRNAVIVDVKLAPRNARGMVEYATDVMILRPIDRPKGNGKIFFELNNRGGLLTFAQMNDAAADTNDPSTPADAGNGFLMRQGYTFVSAAWDALAIPGGGRFQIQVPVAHKPDGSEITGLSMDEFVIDDDKTTRVALTYPTANRDTANALLTLRRNVDDDPIRVEANAWTFNADGTGISLLPEGSPFKAGSLYHLVYEAKNPRVAGLGFAAARDVAVFLRAAKTDDAGNPNPLAGDIKQVYSYCISQPCRMMRDFVALGFNQAEAQEGAQAPTPVAFDGLLNWVGGSSGIS